MKLSESRIPTTHVGSLPRNSTLLKMLLTVEQGGEVERQAFRAQVSADMVDIIRRQAQSGVDIAGNGELPRIGLSFYVEDG